MLFSCGGGDGGGAVGMIDEAGVVKNAAREAAELHAALSTPEWHDERPVTHVLCFYMPGEGGGVLFTVVGSR